jgi:hypothetical protein
MISDACGPIAQTRLGQVNKLEICADCSPTAPPIVRLGKYAARAIPMPSFASATRRSADAMSGRRSNSCEGKPTGMAGGANGCDREAMANSAGGLPTGWRLRVHIERASPRYRYPARAWYRAGFVLAPRRTHRPPPPLKSTPVSSTISA